MASISVAMAVYNGEKYLPEQLDSILCQLEPQDEIVISYDKSKDGTWQLIQSYSEKHLFHRRSREFHRKSQLFFPLYLQLHI